MIYGYQGVFNHAGTVAGKEIKTEAGMEVRYDLVDDIALSSTVRRAHLANKQLGDIREGTINAYLNGTLLLNDRWSVNGAARFDFFSFYYRNKLVNQNNSATTSIVSPKLSVNYQLNDEIQFYIKSGYGFHSNDARTIATQRIRQILPKAFGADVGFNAKLFNKSLLHLAFWSLHLDQEFVYVGDEGIVEPNGETLRRGIDLSIRHQVLPWLFIDADVNFTRPQAMGKPRGEHYIPLAPTLTAIGGLTVQLSNGWNGSVRYRYLGDRAANETNSVVADGYFLADVMVAYTKKKYEIGLSVENFLNANWREAQFDTESRLFNEAESVSEIHFTPGAPFFAKLKFALFFQ
jgi:outer membrane receptor protein involved in Fe transport